MMTPQQRLAENFSCVKCRSKVAHVHTVVLPMARIMAIFSGQVSPQFYVLTCGLCGYSELYDARVFAVQQTPQEQDEPLPQET